MRRIMIQYFPFYREQTVPHSVLQLAYQAYMAKEFKTAIYLYKEVIANDEHLAEAHLFLAESLRKTRLLSEALSHFNKALETITDNPMAYLSRGLAKLQSGQFDESILDFEITLRMRPMHEGALSYRGEAYRNLCRFEEALADFNQILTTLDRDSYALSRRGTILLDRPSDDKAQDYKLAMQDYNLSLEITPDDSFTLAWRGELLRRDGRLELAMMDFNAALRLDPEDTFAQAQLTLTRNAYFAVSPTVKDSDASRLGDFGMFKAIVESVVNAGLDDAITTIDDSMHH